jgi:MFS family permease
MAAGAVRTVGLRRAVALAGAVVFLDTLFYTAITPLLPGYVHSLGLSHAEAGILTASYPIGTLLTAFPAAWLGARLGVRPTFVAGLGLFAVSSLVFGLAHSAPLLVGARFIQGVSGACSWNAALGWVAVITPPARRGAMLGLALSASTAGTIVGPALGSLAAATSTEAVFGAVAVLAVLLLLLVLPVAEGPGERVGRDTVRAVTRSRTAWAGSGLYALFGLTGGCLALLGPLNLSAAGAGATAIGAVFLIAALAELVVGPLAGRAADRFTRLAPVRATLPFAAVAALVLAFAEGGVVIGLMLIVAFGATGALMAPGSTLLADAAEARALPQLAVGGLGNVAWSLGEMSGALGAGVVGTEVACLVLSAATLGVWGWAMAVGRR